MFVTSLSAFEDSPQVVLKDAARFIGADADLIGNAHVVPNPNAVKVMGGMSDWAKRELGKFYHSHNAQLLHLCNQQDKVTFSPSLKGLGIQSWPS